MLSLPVLEQFHWQDSSLGEIDYLLPSQILKLSLIMLPPSYLVLCEGHRSRFKRILQIFQHIGTLHLDMHVAPDYTEQRVLIANINRSFFWELYLTVNKVADHWFTPTILNLLNRCYWVTTLSLQIVADHREVWSKISSHPVMLIVIAAHYKPRETEGRFAIKKVSGTGDEIYFIRDIVANAKTLRKVDNIIPSWDANCDCRTLQTWGDRKISLHYLKLCIISSSKFKRHSSCCHFRPRETR
ncbi:hypothetical protein EJB05_12133, partial [Eragrostis curvula]